MRYLLKISPITFAMKETDNQTRMHSLSNVFRIAVGCLMLTLASCGTAKLSVMSFNVRQSHAKEVNPNDSWNNRKEACLEMLQQRKPDLVGLQEAQFKGQWSYLRDTLSTEYGSYGVGRRNGIDKGECMGILYRKDVLTLLNQGTFWQSETPDQPSACFDDVNERSVTWAVFKINKTGKKFFYVNTHMGLSDNSRSKGMEVILQRIPELNPDNLPVIITGDFNTTQGNFIFKGLRHSMVDSREVAPVTDNIKTYNAWGNEKKAAVIDHIWISKGMKCLEYHTDTNPYGGHELISDHYPVYIMVKL